MDGDALCTSGFPSLIPVQRPDDGPAASFCPTPAAGTERE